MSITWKDVKTPKDFENYILYRMNASPTLKDSLPETTGSCEDCLLTDCTHYCVDIKGTYKGKIFVIDAKFYTSGGYISKKDIDKLERDMKEFHAEVGFILTFAAKISDKKEADANEQDMFIIHVRNENENATHWISEFASHF